MDRKALVRVVALWGAALVLLGARGERGTLAALHGAPDYVAGKPLAISMEITYQQAPSAMGLRAFLPAGWRFRSVDGSGRPDISPRGGTTGTLEFAWIQVPESPVVFSYTVDIPEGADGTVALRAEVEYRLDAGPLVEQASPDPLTMAPAARRAASLAVEPTSLDLGTVDVGGAGSAGIVRLWNRGSEDLHVSRVTVAGGAGFRLDPSGGASPCGTPAPVLRPGASCTVGVAFSPVAAGPASGFLTVASDDPQAAAVTVRMVGEGLAPPEEERQPPSEPPQAEGKTGERDAAGESRPTVEGSRTPAGSAVRPSPRGGAESPRSGPAPADSGGSGGGCFVHTVAW